MILIILCISLFFLFIIQSDNCIAATSEAFLNCLFIVIPSIFPFMVLAEILSKTDFFNLIRKKTDKLSRILFGISGNAFPIVILGYLCGFPGGAKLTSTLYKKNEISYEDAIKLSVFTNNPGPLFVIGTIGYGILDSTKTGIHLFLIQLIASLVSGTVINKFINIHSLPNKTISKTGSAENSALKNITESISSCFQAMIPITGTIIFFTFLSEAIISSGIFTPFIKTLNFDAEITENFIRAVFGLSNGISNLAPIISDEKTLFILLCGICSWSGISVHMQVLNFYTSVKIETKYYFIGKFSTMFISCLLALWLT